MKILLEELQHQQECLNSIIENFSGIQKEEKVSRDNSTRNPLVVGCYNDKSNIDIKMETGTGKTYVYTRTMFELHKTYGLFKFVIVVPSPAIKEGTKNFIESNYARQHFSQFYENTRIELDVINSGDFKQKSGRKNFPAHLSNFVEGSRFSTHTIHVLLINADMLRSSSMLKDDYDQTLAGGTTCPIEAIKGTCPIVIIDEPHRFPRDKSNYSAIQSISPQLVIRFGATFPDIVEGKGARKVVRKDYFRMKPQYELNAVESFNQGLVKGIDIYYPELTESQAQNIYKVENITSKELIIKRGSKVWDLAIGDNLSEVDEGFEGDIKYIGNRELSNGLELDIGMALISGTFKSSYQELIIRDAIDKHFEIEEQNFLRSNNKEHCEPRIKTLSLFFIDSISSYRNTDGWLKLTFEKLLTKKLNQLVAQYEFRKLPREKEYLEFLRATQTNLSLDSQLVHGGYFGEDRGTGDEAIQAEVDDILKNKEKLLSFQNGEGEWQTRRFLFSKWTLREGWDNPNVFVITKLRTSGSENSKIQEVGRGLRLPVDETGRRVRSSEWESRLAFLIGYDEKDFANKLVGEINSDTKLHINFEKLTDDMIKHIVDFQQRVTPSFSEEGLLKHLDSLGIINRKNEFKDAVMINGVTKTGYDWFVDFYPEINNVKLRDGQVRDRSKILANQSVKLKKTNWLKVKDIWEVFSKGYMIEFSRIPESINLIAKTVIEDVHLYEKETPVRSHSAIVANKENENVSLITQESFYDYVVHRPGLPYGEFIKELNQATGIPIKVIHPLIFGMLTKSLKGENEYLSETSLGNLIREFKIRFDEKFAQMYEYRSLDFQASTSVFDSNKNDFVDFINTDLIGLNFSKNAISDNRYLYETPPLYYDSINPERTLVEHNYPKEVTVFGKLPKNSIRVPKYTGGTTTPDFIFVIENGKDKKMYLLVETKAENMRIDDQIIIEIQKAFFKIHNQYNVVYTAATQPNEVYSKIKELVEGETYEKSATN